MRARVPGSENSAHNRYAAACSKKRHMQRQTILLEAFRKEDACTTKQQMDCVVCMMCVFILGRDPVPAPRGVFCDNLSRAARVLERYATYIAAALCLGNGLCHS